MQQPFIERTVYTPSGLRIALKQWGPENGLPVLALHGWLDNAASFDALAPLLPDCRILAMDLPGHGLSAHRHAQGTYNLWDDLREILAVADDYGWQHFALLGHSRGAMIATLLAACEPYRISHLITLDGIVPPPVPPIEAPAQLAKHLNDYRRQRRTPRLYKSIEEAVQARVQVSGISEPSATMLLQRGLEHTEEGYRWNSDPRLRGASAFRLSEQHNDAFLKALTMPALVLLAEQGFGSLDDVVARLRSYPNLKVELLAGTHHFHMEEPAAVIAQRITAFLNEHPTELENDG